MTDVEALARARYTPIAFPAVRGQICTVTSVNRTTGAEETSCEAWSPCNASAALACRCQWRQSVYACSRARDWGGAWSAASGAYVEGANLEQLASWLGFNYSSSAAVNLTAVAGDDDKWSGYVAGASLHTLVMRDWGADGWNSGQDWRLYESDGVTAVHTETLSTGDYGEVSLYLSTTDVYKIQVSDCVPSKGTADEVRASICVQAYVCAHVRARVLL